MNEFIQNLIEWDRGVTVALNGSHSIFMDRFAFLHTSPWFWIPLALVALFIIIRNIPSKNLILAIVAIALTIVICDQLSSGLCKPLFARFRPSRDIVILDAVDTVNGYRGGLYGFFSGHAANSFGIAVLVALLVRNWVFSLSVIAWASLNAYIRVYLGVHFFGDIITGALVGTLVALLVYFLFRLITDKGYGKSYNSRLNRSLYTKSGFLNSDVTLFLIVQFGTYSFLLIGSCIAAF